MKKLKSSKVIYINPYARSLAILLICLCLFMMSLMTGWVVNAILEDGMNYAIEYGYVFGLIFEFGLIVILLCILFINGYEYFGKVRITDRGFVFNAIFHRQRVFAYEEIKQIEIDYGWLSDRRQFWIIVSKTPVDIKYLHRATKIKFSKSTMKIAYSPEVYDILCRKIEDARLSKQLFRAHTTMQLYE